MKKYKLALLLGLILITTGCTLNTTPEEVPEQLLDKSNPLSIEDNLSSMNNKSEESIEDGINKPRDETSNNPLEEEKEDMDQELIEDNLPERLLAPKIIVKKSIRMLELWDGDSLVQSYPIGLGFNPIGHKVVEGDGRTPEGDYYVCTRNDESKFYKSLGVSYPNKKDAQTALESETIDELTYKSIIDSFDKKTKPPWNTPMGGQIMIHGHGGHRDWTQGCVAVDDDIMDILWNYCPIETPIIILP